MWLNSFIFVVFMLAVLILTEIGKRNIIILIKALKTISLFFVPFFIIMMISGVSDKLFIIFDIIFIIFIVVGLIIVFIVVKRRKYFDEIDRERIIAIISISIVSMVGIIIQFIVQLIIKIFK